MQLTFIYLKLVSTLIFWKSDSILFENDYQLQNIDTIFYGNLYWDLNCELFIDASYPILDSIIYSSKSKIFDTCRITVFESILKTDSKSCATGKAHQLQENFSIHYPKDLVLITAGVMIVAEKKESTRVVVEVY